MNYNKSFFGLFLAALVLLPGCYHIPTYRSKTLQSVNRNFMYRNVQDKVIVRAKRLNQVEIFHLFGERGGWLVNKHNTIRPVYITITNHSKYTYVVDPKEIDLELLDYKFVALYMKTGMLGQPGKNARKMAIEDEVVTQSLMLPVAPIAGVSLMGATWSVIGGVKQGVWFLVPFIGAAVFPFIPMIRAGLNNRRVKKDLQDKVLYKKEIIRPGEQLNKLIFIKSTDYKPAFNLTLYEKDNVESNIIFDVDVRKSV